MSAIMADSRYYPEGINPAQLAIPSPHYQNMEPNFPRRESEGCSQQDYNTFQPERRTFSSSTVSEGKGLTSGPINNALSGTIDDHLHNFPVEVHEPKRASLSHPMVSRVTNLDPDSPILETESSAQAPTGASGSGQRKVRAKLAKISTDDEGPRFCCWRPGCPKTFKGKKYLDRHLKTSHEAQRPHQCAFCGSTFTRTDSRKRHQDECIQRQQKHRNAGNQQGQKRPHEEHTSEQQQVRHFAGPQDPGLTVNTRIAGHAYNIQSANASLIPSDTFAKLAQSGSPVGHTGHIGLAGPPLVNPRSSSLPHRYGGKPSSRPTILHSDYHHHKSLQSNSQIDPRSTHRHSSSADLPLTHHNTLPESRSHGQLRASDFDIRLFETFSGIPPSPGPSSAGLPEWSHPSTPQFAGHESPEFLRGGGRYPYESSNRSSFVDPMSRFTFGHSTSSLDLNGEKPLGTTADQFSADQTGQTITFGQIEQPQVQTSVTMSIPFAGVSVQESPQSIHQDVTASMDHDGPLFAQPLPNLGTADLNTYSNTGQLSETTFGAGSFDTAFANDQMSLHEPPTEYEYTVNAALVGNPGLFPLQDFSYGTHDSMVSFNSLNQQMNENYTTSSSTNTNDNNTTVVYPTFQSSPTYSEFTQWNTYLHAGASPQSPITSVYAG